MTKANAKSRKAVLGRMPVLALLASLMTSIAYADAAYTVVTNDQGEVTVRATTPSGAEVDLAFWDPDVKSVTYERNEGGSILLTGTEPSTYTGGTTVNVNQLRFRNPCAFGTGPIVLNCNDGGFMNRDWSAGVDLSNKVVFAAIDWAMGLDSNNLTLHALGSTLSPALGYLGRSSGSKCLISLALDSSENDPLDGVVLRGTQTMNIDGGIFKAKASAQPDYFTLNNPSTDSIKTKVSDKGFTFDVAEGGSTRFGIPLAIDNPPVVTTNMTVWGEPSNNSFENSSTGWTLNKGEISKTSAVVANSNTSWIFSDTETVSYDRFRTKFGTNQLAVRGGNNVVSPPLVVTESGEGYVTFWMTSRPSKSGSDYNSDHLAVDVTLTAVEGSAQTVTLPGRPKNLSQTYGYLQYCIGPFSVKQGEYTITLKVEKGEADSKALFFDLIQLCDCSFTTNLTTVAKTGAGVVTFDDLNFSRGLLAVRGGELRFGDSRLTDMSAEVSAGATFAVGAAATFDNAVVKVPADATLRFVGPIETNLIRNPSFEEDEVTKTSGYDYIKPTGWTPKVVESNYQNSYEPYYCQTNGSTLSKTKPWTPAGNKTVALREKVCLKQSFTAARAGAYRIAFIYACRDWTPSTNLRLHACIDHDGEKIALTEDGGLVPSSEAYASFSAVIELTAGIHELRFDADGDDTEARGAVIMIDDVVAAECRTANTSFTGVRFDLASGSTLRLDNPERVTVDEFYVDGVRLSGGKSAIRKAGVTVVGNGSIHVGDAVGMTILLR